ncbi:MAG: hypothetical protein ABSG76_09605 [Xanthobacteraceae bacterium]
MMSGRAYAIRLAQVVSIFAVVIPALAVAVLYAIWTTHDGDGIGIFFEFVIMFVGGLLWLLCFAGALWRTVYRRTRTIGLPFWVSLLVLILLAEEDWRSLRPEGACRNRRKIRVAPVL